MSEPKWKGREKDYQKEYMREYRARQKYDKVKKEIKAFVKTLTPFKDEFAEMLVKIIKSQNRFQTTCSLSTEKESLMGQLKKEFDEHWIKHEILKKTDRVEAEKLLKRMEAIGQQVKIVSMELTTLEFCKTIFRTINVEELRSRVHT